MNLYYNKVVNRWFHSFGQHSLFIGATNNKIEFLNPRHIEQQQLVPFSTQLFKQKIGPMIGIVVHENKDKKLVVNEPFTTSLAKQIIQLKAIPLLLPIERIQDDFIEGAIFDQSKEQWVKGRFPLPDVLFNRITNRKLERTERFHSSIDYIKMKGVPFFNPQFLDKYHTYRRLCENHFLQPFPPETIMIHSKQDLSIFCNKWETIYLKPCNNFKGNGIYVIKKRSNGQIALRSFNKKNVFQSFDDFWEIEGSILLKKRYLAQQAIYPKKRNGRRYDLRVLAHFSGDHYEITGVGVRMAGPHNITTHIPRGGKLIPYHDIQTDHLDYKLQQLINEIGKELSAHYGFFGEFTVDIGISKKDELKIFEVNAKPMIFDENHIEQLRLEKLSQLLIKLAKERWMQ